MYQAKRYILYISFLLLIRTSCGRYYDVHFICEETVAQSGEITCLMLPQRAVAGLVFKILKGDV